ncbi:hypothetical protein [Lactococcus termiticola]|uniref:Uncharacterized protein n=1 Tax=Lactococcus termiticola TaxID=2169526 RepID=A0A2R5HHI8_9LACT|nr:hypothetical protein [Lactococcus termiticola]GBG97442.1 hypothetical protein NtB2_01587 [Lactococcus termiticola]
MTTTKKIILIVGLVVALFAIVGKLTAGGGNKSDTKSVGKAVDVSKLYPGATTSGDYVVSGDKAYPINYETLADTQVEKAGSFDAFVIYKKDCKVCQKDMPIIESDNSELEQAGKFEYRDDQAKLVQLLGSSQAYENIAKYRFPVFINVSPQRTVAVASNPLP